MKRLLVAWTCVLALGALPAAARADALLPEATNLAADAQTSAARGMPILIEMARHDCSYCEKLREDFLKPMIRSGDYRQRVVFRQLHIDGQLPLTDFDGRKIEPGAFALRYHVDLTPTVLLLGPHGRLLAKPLVGLTTEDFYGAYLDEAIDQAVAKLRGKGT